MRICVSRSTALLASVEEEKQQLAAMVDKASKAAGRTDERGRGDIDDVFTSQIDELKVKARISGRN
jgi:hypothetical protein